MQTDFVYAGIGSRETPTFILGYMTGLAMRLQKEGWWLSSGGAKGADTAFENGAGEHKTIYRPKHANPAALELAAKFHPAWDRCDQYAKELHARNGMIVLGVDLKTPVKFIACWTKAGLAGGGTGQALRIAKAYNIPVFNFAIDGAMDGLDQFIKTVGDINENAG